MTRDLERRLLRLEGCRVQGEPTRILSDCYLDDAEAADALHRWRAWVARGEASREGDVLCILTPEMTEEEWAGSL